MSNLPEATQHTYELGASAQAHLQRVQSVLRVALLAGALCLTAHSVAQDALLTSSGIGYTTNNGTATITHYAISVATDTSVTGAVVIPSTLEGIPVTGIGPHAIHHLGTLGYPFGADSASGPTTVFIPAGITNIHALAFSGAWDLTSIVVHRANPAYRSHDGILFTKDLTTLLRCPQAREGGFTIPASVTIVAAEAFEGCSSLITINLPAGLVSIGANALSECRNLASIDLPAGVVSIEVGAFGGCYNLTDIFVAPGNPAYTSLDGVLFEKDQSVLVQCPAGRTGDFVIPDTVTHIGAAAFSTCDRLTSIVIPEGVTHIGDYAFDQCRSLARLTLPSSLRHLGDGALRYCSALTDLVIPENTVGSLYDLLLGCDALRHLTLPAGVTDISSSAFRDVRNLRSITVAPDNPAYLSLDGVLFNKNLTALVHYPKGRIGSFAIPHGVGDIPAGAFEDCVHLTGISLPHSLTRIGSRAFAGCTSLAEVVIPPTVLEIGDSAFYGCTNLGSITIPEGVTRLGSDAFSGCSQLTNVWIPASLTNLGVWLKSLIASSFSFSGFSRPTMFANCPHLREINVAPDNPVLYSQDGVLFAYDTISPFGIPGLENFQNQGPTLIRFPEGKTGRYSIPTPITSIAAGAFQNCVGLTDVTIPAGVTGIGNSVFKGCSSLRTVRLPDGLTFIGDHSFHGCAKLPDIRIPGTVKIISNGAFGNCTQLTRVVLPEALSVIGDQAFAGCTQLLTVQVPAGVTQIGDGAFQQSPASPHPWIQPFLGNSPDGVVFRLQAIDVDPLNPVYSSVDGVLFNKDQSVLLQYPGGKTGDYIVPTTVTRIEPAAFVGCHGLTSVVLPHGITEIHAYAFGNCIGLASVNLPDTVVSLGYSAFYGCTALDTIRIPGSIADLPGNVFENCTTLSEVTLENGVRNIGWAFYNCPSLTRISLPDSVASIHSGAFSGCTNLAEFEVSAMNRAYSSQDGVLFNKTGSTLIHFPPGKRGDYVIPEGVTSVEAQAFDRCERLTRIAIPSSLTYMAEWAFAGCPNLTALDVAPANPAYRSTDGVLFDISGAILMQYPLGRTGDYGVPQGVARIGYAFAGCHGLTQVTIPASVVTIDEYSFSGCPSLGAIDVDPLSDSYCSLDGALFDKVMTRLILCPPTMSGSYVIPATVTYVADLAFAYCTNLTALTVPAQITQLVSYHTGWWGCTNLQSVFMQGDAPAVVWFWQGATESSPTVYYRSGTEGWGTELGGMPTALWNPSIGSNGQDLGVGEGGFAFNLNGAPGLVVIVEACTDLAHPAWTPISTNSLTAGSTVFQDPDWLNHPGRFYRLRSL